MQAVNEAQEFFTYINPTRKVVLLFHLTDEEMNTQA